VHRRAFWVSVMAAVVVTGQASPTYAESGPADLLAEAKWTSTGGGKVAAEAKFTVADPDAVAGLLVIPGLAKPSLTLNGKPVSGPLNGMSYSRFQLDPQQYLVKGENVLIVRGEVGGKGQRPAAGTPQARVLGYTPEMAAIQTGPVLGTAGSDFFTVTCRTNVPAAVTVTAKPAEPAGGRETSATSDRGFYHRLHVKLSPGTRKFAYTVTVQAGAFKKTDGPYTVGVPGAGSTLRFAAAGDNRSNPKTWHAITAAIEKAKPDLAFFSGDFVFHGAIDDLWDTDYFGPARSLLATIPTYGVLGNHDQNSPVYFEMFYSPGGDGRNMNWSQQIGDVLFIGIHGGRRGNAAQWIEPVLAQSKAKFIFLFTHYPAWSSGPHGKEGGGDSRKVIMPILAKYRATAMFAGHDHDYERSEPPPDQGVTCIVAGCAGAPTYQKDSQSAKLNPYSKVFVGTPNYCILEVKGDTCQMQAYDLKGNLIDQATFKARTASGAKKTD